MKSAFWAIPGASFFIISHHVVDKDTVKIQEMSRCHTNLWEVGNTNTYRGDCDYCQVPGTRELTPLEVGDDNSEPKNLRKN